MFSQKCSGEVLFNFCFNHIHREFLNMSITIGNSHRNLCLYTGTCLYLKKKYIFKRSFSILKINTGFNIGKKIFKNLQFLQGSSE